jgi:hypothetical protein
MVCQATTPPLTGDSVKPTKLIISKYPAYGKVLADRQRWNNKPMFVFVCVGGDAFRQAQKYNQDRDNAAMVLTPGQDAKALIWSVKNCPVIIKWDGSAPTKTIIELVKCLLRSSATSVTVWPTWENFNTPSGYYDCTQYPLKWVNTREIIRTYFPKAVQA